MRNMERERLERQIRERQDAQRIARNHWCDGGKRVDTTQGQFWLQAINKNVRAVEELQRRLARLV